MNLIDSLSNPTLTWVYLYPTRSSSCARVSFHFRLRLSCAAEFSFCALSLLFMVVWFCSSSSIVPLLSLCMFLKLFTRCKWILFGFLVNCFRTLFLWFSSWAFGFVLFLGSSRDVLEGSWRQVRVATRVPGGGSVPVYVSFTASSRACRRRRWECL